VRLRGRPAKKSDLVLEGDELVVELGPTRAATPRASALALRFVSDDWVVAAKPAGLPTAPRNSEDTDTLANALVEAFPEMAAIGHRALEPGLLHRLDNGTSGLIVAARTERAFVRGTRALKACEWNKSYLALITNSTLPDCGILRGRLEAWPGHSKRVRGSSSISLSETTSNAVAEAGASPFETRYLTEMHLTRGLRLVRVFVGPAFRHQIRAHFAEVGAPLLNDEIYGAPREPRLGEGRHALHAARVAWGGDPDLPGFNVTEPLAADLLTLVEGSCA